MKRWSLCAAITAALACSPALAAVSLDPQGLGQGLLYPYFTTHNGQTTLLTVQNTADEGKAVKVRVMESYAGLETLTFNLYLGPGATWSGALTQMDDGPALVSNDTTCTAPSLQANGERLRPYAYEGDAGPQDPDRMREGFVEIVGMGTLNAELSEFAGHPGTENCATFTYRFAQGGAWSTNANADLTAPGDGLRGNAILIDTADGTSFTYRALAFDGLAVAPRQFPLTGEAQDFSSPRLTDVQVADGEDIDVNLVDASGNAVTLRYDAEEGFKAISALLATYTALGSYNLDPGTRARSEWVYSFPTRRAHLLSAGTTAECETVPVSVVDRSGSAVDAEDTVELCGAAGVVRFADPELGTSPIFALENDPVIQPAAAAGNVALDFRVFDEDVLQGWPDLDGKCLMGLPVWVMSVSAFDNANAQPDRIATYPVSEVVPGASEVIDCSGDWP